MNKSENAFTLLELIIALSIGATLILVVSLSVKMGFSHMERGSSWLDENHREKNAIRFFNQQISSMASKTIGKEIIFQGDSDRVLFITPLSLEKRYGLGFMTVLYYLEEDDRGVALVYKEKRFIPDENIDKFKDEDSIMFDGSESVTFFEGCDEVSFEFLNVQGSEIEIITKDIIDYEWNDLWEKNSLPKAIKLKMSKDGQDREFIAPVMVMY